MGRKDKILFLNKKARFDKKIFLEGIEKIKKEIEVSDECDR